MIDFSQILFKKNQKVKFMQIEWSSHSQLTNRLKVSE